ncbi:MULTISPECIES: FmdB family zinc ribbon protein [Rhodomicrobium]|uniref:FmdB family zinc ribbon protein n=1 Tax=Rhodomicrobium TaxID=1068 RepID=UPI000B4B88B2|nr:MULTISPECIES: FmdB family zinc ribbon protein [Rhodomicrobium]
MPVYDYDCAHCGPFTATQQMARSAEPLACPECGEAAPRAFFTAPAVAGMDAGRRSAMASNERSASEPRQSKAHGAGCGCCAAPRKVRAPG